MSICKVKDNEYQWNYRNKSCKSETKRRGIRLLTQLGQVTVFADSVLKNLTMKFWKNSFFSWSDNLLPLYGSAAKAQYFQVVLDTLTLRTPIFERTVSRSCVIFLPFYRQKHTPMIFSGAQRVWEVSCTRDRKRGKLACVQPKKQQEHWWLRKR